MVRRKTLGLYLWLSFSLLLPPSTLAYSVEGDVYRELPVEKRLLDFPRDIQRKYRNIFTILPDDKKSIFISILEKLPDPSVFKLLEIIGDMDLVEILNFLDELYLIKDPAARSSFISRKYMERTERISVVEKFYSTGPFIGAMFEGRFKQIGYDILATPPQQRVLPHFVSHGYVLGPGDSLFVYVWGKVRVPEFSSFPTVVTVLSDGKIFIPVVGPVAVGGLTVEAASELIKNAFRKVFGDVEVAVTLSSLRSVPVIVMGEVRKPGVVVLSGTLSTFEAIQEAGGIKPSGSLRNIEVRRNGRVIARVDLYELVFKGKTEGVLEGGGLRAWDVVFVPRIGRTFAVVGSVKTPGIYEMKGEGTKISEAIELAGLIPEQGNFRMRVRRFEGERRETILDTLYSPRTTELVDGFVLMDGDIVEIYPVYSEVEDKYVFVSGYVKRSQKIPFRERLSLKDVVMLSGGFGSAELPYAYEIIRQSDGREFRLYRRIPDDIRKIGVEEILNELEKELMLPYDRITIYPPPEGEVVRNIEVKISGEVVFPGRYLMQKGDRIYDLIKKAGGFTDRAYPEGIVFIRQSLKQVQMDVLERVVQILTKDLISESSAYVQVGGVPTRRGGENISEMIRAVRFFMEAAGIAGRIVIKCSRDLESFKDSPGNLELQADDEVYVPNIPDYVIVSGEVKHPTTFSYLPGKDADFYVKLAGGYTRYSNRAEVFVIRANGEADTNVSKIMPGDTIVVPPRIRVPYETWFIVRDVLSVSFQGLTAGALILNALR